MTTNPYPVVHERALPPPHRRRLRGSRRDPADLPTPAPGTVLVFRVGDRYEQRGGGGHLTGTEPNVVHATAVCVVDVRERLVHTDVSIPSASPADDFTVRIGFRCRVTQPAVVAQAGLTDLSSALASHLLADLVLPTIGVGHSIEDVNQVRRRAEARVLAYWDLSPSPLVGVDVRLATVEVLTPDDLRAQSRRVRDERWRQTVEVLERDFEDENVQRLAAHIRSGEDRVAALGVARGEVNIGQVLEQLYETEQRREAQQAELIKVLAEAGHTDRVPVNVRPLLDAYLQRVVGASSLTTAPTAGVAGADGSDEANEVDGASGQQLPSGSDDDNDRGPQHVPDEDELTT